MPSEPKNQHGMDDADQREQGALLGSLGKKIQQAKRSCVRGILEIGRCVWDARQILGTQKGRGGRLSAWLRSEGLARSTAYKCEAAFKVFCPDGEIVSEMDSFDPQAVYLLSAKGTSELAVKECLERARKGELVSATVAADAIRKCHGQRNVHVPAFRRATGARTPTSVRTPPDSLLVTTVQGVGDVIIRRNADADDTKLNMVMDAIVAALTAELDAGDL